MDMKKTSRVREAIRIIVAVLAIGGGMEGTAVGGSFEEYAAAVAQGDPVTRLGIDTWFLWTAGN